MIPTLEDIVRDLAAGTMTAEQALAWLKMHEAGAYTKQEQRANDLRLFSGMAMQGFLSNPNPSYCEMTGTEIANQSLICADAMLSRIERAEEAGSDGTR